MYSGVKRFKGLIFTVYLGKGLVACLSLAIVTIEEYPLIDKAHNHPNPYPSTTRYHLPITPCLQFIIMYLCITASGFGAASFSITGDITVLFSAIYLVRSAAL
jgi:hypothetical protein